MATNRAMPSTNNPRVAVQRHFGNLEVVSVDTKNWEAKFQVKGTNGPEFRTPLSMVRPLSAEDSDQFWQMLVDDVIANLKAEGKYANFVKGYEVWTDEDSTGDPAVYVRILVAPSKGLASKATVDKWNKFVDAVHEALLKLRLQRWPYVQIGEARRK